MKRKTSFGKGVKRQKYNDKKMSMLNRTRGGIRL